MKRHPSLHPLSEHHHHVLVQVLEMRRAAEATAARRAEAIRKAAETFVHFWKQNGSTHFREEEEILLPAYARRARIDEDQDVLRMLAQHAEIRALVQDLEAGLGTGAALDHDVARLAQLLHDHVRLEEDKIFPRMEQVLGEEGLAGMGTQLTRLHPKRVSSK